MLSAPHDHRPFPPPHHSREPALATRLRRFLRPGGISGEPKVTYALIAANLILFAAMLIQGWAAGMGTSILFHPNTSLLLHAGAQMWGLVIYHDQWWRCLTYAFTHAGLIHLGFNMVVLYQVGPLVEFAIGGSRYLVLYTLGALTATGAGLLVHPNTPVVGASGAIFGLIAFAAAYYHRQGDPLSLQRRNFMLQWALFAFIFGLLVGADNAGHLGGAVAGGLLGMVLPLRGSWYRRSQPVFNGLAALCLLALLTSFAMLVRSWLTG